MSLSASLLDLEARDLKVTFQGISQLYVKERMMKTRVSVFVQSVCMMVLGFVIALPAHAGLIHDVNITPDSEYIDYGLNFPWVVPVGVQSDGVWTFGGSGVVIAPGVVAFSSHQTYADGNNSSPFDGYSVRFTSNFITDPAERIEAHSIVRHPDYQGVRSGPDIALMFFEDTEAFSIFPELTLYSGPHAVGTPYDVVGFGVYGTPSTGLVSYTGDRRAGTNLLTDVDNPVDYMRARFLSPSETGFQELGLLATPGDSGGGWFIDVNGELQLAGITSDWDGFAGYGSRSYATYFTPDTVAWINSEIHAQAVPEPSS